MPTIFSYRTGSENQGLLLKAGSEKASYVIDFANGVLGSATLSTTSVGAVTSANQVTTSTMVGTTTISGTTVQQTLLTGGAGGTSLATNGARFKVSTWVTLSNGEILAYDTFVQIIEPAYAPAA